MALWKINFENGSAVRHIDADLVAFNPSGDVIIFRKNDKDVALASVINVTVVTKETIQ